MKVSIIVPNRNYARYLPACLESIACQTYQDIEVLLADGGSSDDSLFVLENFSKRYNWKIFSYSDNGQIDALSKGFKIASGEILCWLNSDDIFLSRRSIQIAVDYFASLIDVDAITLGGYYVDTNGRYIKPVRLYYHPFLTQKDIPYRLGLLQPATFWKKSVADKISLDYSLPYSFDSDFLINVYKQYNLFMDQSIPIAGYRLHGDNLSLEVKKERILDLAKLNEKNLDSIFRVKYLYFVASLVGAISLLPNSISKRLNLFVYVLNNLISYITIYRIPSI